MKAADALIFWDIPSPDHPKGKILIVAYGKDGFEPGQGEYAFSGGAAYVHRRNLKGYEQLAYVFGDFNHLAVHYGIDPALLHEEFLKIDEYREEWEWQF